MNKEDSRYIWIAETEDNQNYISMSRPRGYLSMCCPNTAGYNKKNRGYGHEIKNEDVIQFPVAVAVGDNPIAVSANSVIISGNKLFIGEYEYEYESGLDLLSTANEATQIKDYKLNMDGKDLDIKIGKDGNISINGKGIKEVESEE